MITDLGSFEELPKPKKPIGDKFEWYGFRPEERVSGSTTTHFEVRTKTPMCGNTYHNGVFTSEEKNVTCSLCLKKLMKN